MDFAAMVNTSTLSSTASHSTPTRTLLSVGPIPILYPPVARQRPAEISVPGSDHHLTLGHGPVVGSTLHPEFPFTLGYGPVVVTITMTSSSPARSTAPSTLVKVVKPLAEGS